MMKMLVGMGFAILLLGTGVLSTKVLAEMKPTAQAQNELDEAAVRAAIDARLHELLSAKMRLAER
jgi:hypothetical protein